MKFQLITALLAGAAAAVPTQPQDSNKSLDKRLDPLTLAIVGGVTSGLVGVSGNEALRTIKNVHNWNEAREAFTRGTVRQMYTRARAGESAVCYNKGYTISKPNQVRELTSVQFKSGLLNTDYDCFYMKGPDNKFTSNGDGGYINLAIMSHPACNFLGASSDLYCK